MMFENPDYQVDEQSEEYRLLNPIVSKVGQRRRERLQQLAEQEAMQKVPYVQIIRKCETLYFSLKTNLCI